MRLKTVKIIGFKSFADKITLDFQGDIVAVVGPNGCGKSNIVDAFRWVLGEQSAKSLRGDKMLDVIFAGADSRKALNMAEVTVTLTDVAGQLPVEFEELAITRRLHRSGESEYFINQQPVRLKDIQSLLWDSGVGKNAFSIFEQGKLDQIIQLNPLERRVIFDEAAGIGRFRERKKESLRKLEQVSENKNRVKDVYGEVNKLTKTLEKKSQQAQLFQECKKEYEELEKNILFFNFQELSKNHHNLSLSQKKIQEELKEVVAAHQFLMGRVQESKTNAISQEKTVKSLSLHLQSLSTKLALKNNELTSLQEGLQKGASQGELLAKESELFQKEFIKYEQIALDYQVALNALDEKRKIAQAEVDQLRHIYKEAESAINKKREATKNLQKDHLKALNDEKSISFKCGQEELKQSQLIDKKEAIFLDQKNASKVLQSLEQTIADKKQIVEEFKNKISLKKELLKKVENQFFDLEEQLKKLDKEYTSKNIQLADITARKNSLERLKLDLEGFSKGVKALLELSEKKNSPFYQKIRPLYSYFSIKQGFEALVALGLNRYKDTIVVERGEDFDLLLKYADDHKIKNFSVICLDHVNRNCSEVESEKPLLKDYLKDNLNVNYKNLLSLIENILVTDSLKNDLKKDPKHFFYSSSEIVDRQGYMIDHRGVVSQIELSKGESNHFIRESEIKQLQVQIGNINGEIEQVQAIQLKTLEIKKEVGAKRLSLDQEMRKEEMNLVQDNFHLQKLIEEKSQLEKRQLILVQELQKVEIAINESKINLKNLNERETELKQLTQSLFLKIQEDENSFQKDELFLKSRGKDRYEKDQQCQQILQEFQKTQQLKTILETKWQEQEKSHARITQQLLSLESLKIDGQARLEELQNARSNLSMEEIEIRSQFEIAETELSKTKHELSQIESALQKKDRRIAELESESQYSALSLEGKSQQRADLLQKLQERFKLEINEIQSQSEIEIDLPSAERRARELLAKLDKIGPVDLNSIAEYEEQKKRSDFYSSQLKDLEESEDELKKVIEQLESESRKNFKKTFQNIKENFQKNFQILFQGGEADLQFTDSSDLLEAGVEIIAKPPGKQMRSISLLSGGEKCLTALALLFSIFEEKPAPFCILDEVDAPLDETNVDRFTEVLKRFKDQTQFILITHNKKTMSNADILFGVSMEEKGVSKLISLAFEKKEVTAPLPEEVLV